MYKHAKKHVGVVVIVISLMICWVIIEFNPAYKANLNSGTLSFENNPDFFFERNNAQRSGSQSSNERRTIILRGSQKTNRSTSTSSGGSSGSSRTATSRERAPETVKEQGSTSLYEDSRDFTRSTYNATRMGYEILQEDPMNTADRLMHDEEYQKELQRTVDDLMESSERVQRRVDDAQDRVNRTLDRFNRRRD